MSRPLQDHPGDRLKHLRKRVGKSQEEMGVSLGLATKTYQRYERGERELPAAVVDRAWDEFGVNPDWLWDGRGEMFSRRRQVVPGRDFLPGAEAAPGAALDDTPSGLRRSVDAAGVVHAALDAAGIEAGMALKLALRMLVERHGVTGETLSDLALALREELERASLTGAQQSMTASQDDGRTTVHQSFKGRVGPVAGRDVTYTGKKRGEE